MDQNRQAKAADGDSGSAKPPSLPPPIAVKRSASNTPLLSPVSHQAPAHSSGSGDGGPSWMKMLSSTFLGDHGGGGALSLSASLFTRKPLALTRNSSSPSAASAQPKSSQGGFDHTPTFKLALVGGSGVGKTSILRRWLQRPYASKYSPTIGVDVISTPFRYKNQDINLHIYDVASVEVDNNHSSLHSLICEDLDGIFFVFNVHRVSSIAAVDKWRHSLAKYISATEIPFVLLSHKADMAQKRIMSSDDIASYAKAGGYKAWMWTVGRPNFGENEKHPAVVEALEKMVDWMWTTRELHHRAHSSSTKCAVGIFDTPQGSRKPGLAETIHVDAGCPGSLLLRIPTTTITTLPRDDDLLPIEETFEALPARGRRSSYGGNWMLGNEKGVYLRVTEDSVVAVDHGVESEEEEQEEEEDQGKEDDTEEVDEKEKEEEEEEEGKSEEPRQAPLSPLPPAPAVVSPRVAPAADDELTRPPPPISYQNDHDAWRFFAGSISRTRAEELLSGREEGTFLLRRKDAQTLVLSYVGPSQIHHALLEFKNQKYHVGAAKSSQASFATLSRCLRSVRKYAYRGLVFTRNTDFRVVNKQEMALEEEENPSKATKLFVATGSASTASSSWRPGSNRKSTPKKATASESESPRQQPRQNRPSSGLLAQQEHVQVPPKARIDELSSSFYEQLIQRIQTFQEFQTTQKSKRSPEDEEEIPTTASLIDAEALLEMVTEELKELQAMSSSDAEAQWRKLVKNMELWNRIILNLEINRLLFTLNKESNALRPYKSQAQYSLSSVDQRQNEMEVERLLSSDNDNDEQQELPVSYPVASSPRARNRNKMQSSPRRTKSSPRNGDSPHPNGASVSASTATTATTVDTNNDNHGDGDDVDALERGRKPLLLTIPISALLKSSDRRNSGNLAKTNSNIINGNGTNNTNNNNNGKRRSALATSSSPSVSAAQQRRESRTTTTSTSSSMKEKISVLAVVVHLCKGNIGPGAMSLPSGFSKTGIYAAPIYFVIVALVSTYNMDLLLYCKRMVSPTKPMSFGEVAGKLFGAKGKLLIDVFLVGTQLGICCVYFTFIATNIHVVLPEEMQLVIHERQLIFAIFPVILMLSWIRTLHRITPYSSLANLAVFLGISIVFYYSIDYSTHPNPQKPRIAPVNVDFTQFPEFYGTAVYSFEGIGLILPIQNEMQDPQVFPRVLACVMALILVLFLFIGQVPTLAFGKISSGSMTAVLHEYCDGYLVTMANLLLAFACLLSFPIQFYPAVTVLEKAMTKQRINTNSRRPRRSLRYGGQQQQEEEDEDEEEDSSMVTKKRRESIKRVEAAGHRRRASATTASMSRSIALSSTAAQGPAPRPAQGPPTTATALPRWLDALVCSLSQYECNRTIFRSMLCTALMVVAVCIPDVALLISLFGAVGSSMLAIIVPPVLYLKLHEQTGLSRPSQWLHKGIILFGVVGMVAGTFQAVRDIVATFTSP